MLISEGLLFIIGAISPKSGTPVTRKASVMRRRREEVVEEKEKEMEKEEEEEKEEEVEEKENEKKEKKEEEMEVEELVESTWRKRSMHSIRRNGGRYTSFISDNRFQVIACKSVLFVLQLHVCPMYHVFYEGQRESKFKPITRSSYHP